MLAVLGYNFFFLDPLYTFHISDPENVAGLLLFSAVAVLASSIASRTRSQTLVARQEAARAAALYAFAKKLTGVAGIDDLLWAAAHQVAMMLKAEVVFLLPEDGSLAVLAAYPPEDQLDANDLAAAEWCWRNDTPAGRGSDNLPGAALFLPLRTGRGKLGVAGIKKDLAGPLLTPAERRLLDALLDQTALAIDRVQLARDVDATKLLAETERLRTAAADLDRPRPEDAAGIHPGRRLRPAQLRRLLRRGRPRDLLATAQEEAERLARFVDNLLDMTRLEAGRSDPSASRSTSPTRSARPCAAPAACSPATAWRPTCRPTCRCCAPTSCCWSRCWSTCSRTPPAMRRPARRWRSPRASATRPSCSRSATAALASPDEAGASSTGSTARSTRCPARARSRRGQGLRRAMGGTIAAHERQGGGAVFRLSFPAELVTAARGEEAALAS